MLIAEMTSANTEKETGVVNRLQQMFQRQGSLRHKLISCQHQVLDRILYLLMDDWLHGSIKSLYIDYFFVNDLIQKHDPLKEAFNNGKTMGKLL